VKKVVSHQHKKLATLCIVWALTLLGGCSSNPGVAELQVEAPTEALGNVEYHTAELASELFARLIPNQQDRYAVVGFVPISSLKYNGKQQHPLMLLGHQLEQGLMTQASQRGFIAQDYKAMNDIVVSADADRVLSRDVTKLDSNVHADFYITGTITEQQEGAIVNARIIHVGSKDVVAAATKFFPAELFWQREKVTSRNGMLYRTGAYK
jgi:hypothetical protein